MSEESQKLGAMIFFYIVLAGMFLVFIHLFYKLLLCEQCTQCIGKKENNNGLTNVLDNTLEDKLLK
jgi:hypothetical protein